MPDHDPEHALDQLLRRADERPKIDPEARARILDRLRERRPAEAMKAAAADPPGDPRPESAEPTADAPPPAAEVIDLPDRRWSPVGLGLAFAACLALLWGIPRMMRDRPKGDVDGESLAQHTNTSDRPEAFTLADGSVAWLRSGASIEVLGRRQIRVTGEALLKVAEERRPFTVETAHGRAEARGEVLFRAEATKTLIAVARGQAELLDREGNDGSDGRDHLRAGEQVTLGEGDAPTITAGHRLTHLLGWAQPLFKDPAPSTGVARRGNLLARDPATMAWSTSEWPLPMRNLDVDVVIEDGVARTTLDQTFFNPTYRTLEGVYSFPLPSDAAISRLAMYVGGDLMEGGIVERQRGRTIYESIVYRRRDPALLEQMSGNEFRIRVFPLPSRQEKRLFLSYVEPLAGLYGEQTLRVPLPELDAPVGAVNVKVHLRDGEGWTLRSTSHPLTVKAEGDEELATWSDTGVVLGDDLILTLSPKGQDPAVQVRRDGDQWLVRARPDFGAPSRAKPRRWVILYDTSASRDAGEIAAQERLFSHLLRSIDGEDRLTVLAFDTALREFGPLAPVDELDPLVLRGWVQREGQDHVGATDLAAALARGRDLLDSDARDGEEPVLLYLGDGLAHGDEHSPSELVSIIGASATFVAAALGDPLDTPLLTALADATGGLVTLIDGGEELAWRARELVATLATPRLQNVDVDLLDSRGTPLREGPLDASARTLSDGEDLLLTTTSATPPASVEIRGNVDGAPFSQRLSVPTDALAEGEASEPASFVSLLGARARISALLAEDRSARTEAHRETITALALEHFLVTPYTSLLVVESEAMAERFGLKRPTAGWAPYPAPPSIEVRQEPRGRLGDIRRGTYVHRTPVELLRDPNQGYSDSDWWGLQDQGWAGPFGARGLGLSGTGRGGGGVGGGIIGLDSLLGDAIGSSSRTSAFGGAGSMAQAEEEFATTGAHRLKAMESLSERSSFRRDLQDPSSARRARRRLPTVTRWAGGTGQHRYYGYSGGVTPPYPQAWHYSADRRLDDLTALLPALFEASIDRSRERLLAVHARAGAGSISDAARRMIDRARAQAPTGSFVEDDQRDIIEVEADGALRRTRRIGGYLDEELLFDGATVRTRYPDLDIEVRRDLRGAEHLGYERWAPWLLPSADALAALFEIDVTGDRRVRLRRPDGPGLDPLVIELSFDASGRLIQVLSGDASGGQAPTRTTQIAYPSAGPVVTRDGDTRSFTRAERAPAPSAGHELSVVLDVPYGSIAEAEAAVAEATGPGKRRALHQHLATLLALGRYEQLEAPILALHAEAPLTTGELVLASGGLHRLDAASWKRLRKGLDAEAPVAAYVAAHRGQARAFATIATAHAGTLPGLMASYRSLLDQGERGRAKAAELREFERFLADYDHPVLSYILAWKLANGWSWRKPELAASAWRALADAEPQWRGVALHAAGVARYNRGDMAAAAEHFLVAFEESPKGSVSAPPQVDWTVRQAIQSHRGEATWHLHWSRWRDRVETSGDADQLAAFIAAALRLGDQEAVHRVLARADLSKLDREPGLELVQALLAAGMDAEARPLVRHLRVLAPEDPDVLIASAVLAESLGDLGEAAAALEAAIARPEIADLGELRALYERALQMRARISQAGLDGKPNAQAIDAALAVAKRWRRDDPDNPRIDELSAKLLYSHGLKDAAWRQLSSISERHPSEGDAHARVAALLAREGDLKAANRSLAAAIAAEPTNPTWLLRRAQNLLAADERQQAEADLKAIADGDWQDRFRSVVYEAKTLQDYVDRAAKR